MVITLASLPSLETPAGPSFTPLALHGRSETLVFQLRSWEQPQRLDAYGYLRLAFKTSFEDDFLLPRSSGREGRRDGRSEQEGTGARDATETHLSKQPSG